MKPNYISCEQWLKELNNGKYGMQDGTNQYVYKTRNNGYTLERLHNQEYDSSIETKQFLDEREGELHKYWLTDIEGNVKNRTIEEIIEYL